jgi:hypothetical protein
MSLLRRLGAAAGWLALILAVMGVTWAVGVEGWSDRWGATDDEVAGTLPGDDLIEEPAMVTTRAVTVDAPPELVWPWIAQFGQGRGGLYSYDWLERLFGIDIASVDTILPGEQDIAVGDQIWITQPGYPADLGLVVADMEPGRALVLAASTPDRPAAPEEAPWTWTFVVRSDGDGGTRLIVRNRNATIGAVGDVVWDRVVGPIGFAMERRTILGIAQRAETAAGSDAAPVWREPLWFVALLLTGVAILAITVTRAPLGRRVAYVVAFTAAATLVLFRFPSPWLSVALAAASTFVATLLWRAWPPGAGVERRRVRSGADDRLVTARG